MDARRHVATCGLPFSESTPDAPISNTTDDANVLLFFCMRYALCKIARRGVKRISSGIWVSCTLCMLPVLLLRPGRNVLGLTRFDYGGSSRFFSLAPDFLPVSLLPSHLRSGASVTSTPFFCNLISLCYADKSSVPTSIVLGILLFEHSPGFDVSADHPSTHPFIIIWIIIWILLDDDCQRRSAVYSSLFITPWGFDFPLHIYIAISCIPYFHPTVNPVDQSLLRFDSSAFIHIPFDTHIPFVPRSSKLPT